VCVCAYADFLFDLLVLCDVLAKKRGLNHAGHERRGEGERVEEMSKCPLSVDLAEIFRYDLDE